MRADDFFSALLLLATLVMPVSMALVIWSSYKERKRDALRAARKLAEFKRVAQLSADEYLRERAKRG